jgi:ABC-type branched-subunit amino acid transport system ATPase component
MALRRPVTGACFSIIGEIGRPFDYLRNKRKMEVVPVERCFEFTRDPCDGFAVMVRGQAVLARDRDGMIENDVRHHLSDRAA